jgi:hypothetical protein
LSGGPALFLSFCVAPSLRYQALGCATSPSTAKYLYRIA